MFTRTQQLRKSRELNALQSWLCPTKSSKTNTQIWARLFNDSVKPQHFFPPTNRNQDAEIGNAQLRYPRLAGLNRHRDRLTSAQPARHPAPRLFSHRVLEPEPHDKPIQVLETDVPLQRGSRIVLPFSLGPLDTEDKHKAKAHQRIKLILETFAELYEQGNLERVDVILTGGLQEVNWGKEKACRIEDELYETHHKLLHNLSSVYTWDEWIDTRGRAEFEQHLKYVTEASGEGTEWLNFMTQTHKNTRMSDDLEKSIAYQRHEYAAMMLMAGQYDYLVYLGNLTLAMSYLYHLTPDIELPTFVKASLKTVQPNEGKLTSKLATKIVQDLVDAFHELMTNPEFPKEQQVELLTKLKTITYAYGPPVHDEPNSPFARLQ